MQGFLGVILLKHTQNTHTQTKKKNTKKIQYRPDIIELSELISFCVDMKNDNLELSYRCLSRRGNVTSEIVNCFMYHRHFIALLNQEENNFVDFI